MKKLNLVVALVVGLSMLLSFGCAGRRAQGGAAVGAASGAVIGQALGGSTEATLIGFASGALLGYIIGNEMDKDDRRKVIDTIKENPSNQRSSWVNPDSRKEYTVTPRPVYRDSRIGKICRDAEILVVIDGKAERTTTRACRCPRTGRWELQ